MTNPSSDSEVTGGPDAQVSGDSAATTSIAPASVTACAAAAAGQEPAAAAAAATISQRIPAWISSKLVPRGDRQLQPRKEQLFAMLSRERGVRSMLELGSGCGPNFRYYGSRVDSIIGVDLNPATLQYAAAAAAAAGLPPGRVRLLVASAEALPLADGSVDAVVGTHILCSVSSPAKALSEVLRVLRPGGTYTFIEHVRAPSPATRGATLQRWAAPIVRRIPEGCHVDRDSLAAIRAAGFSAVQADEFDLPVPCPVAFFGPHVCGTAIK